MYTATRKLTPEHKCELLLEISRRSRGTLDLEETLNLLLDAIGTVLRYDAAGIFALNEGVHASETQPGGRIAGMVRRGFPTRPVEEDEMLSTGRGIVGAAIQSGRTVLVPDVRRDPRYIVGRQETLSEVAVPIMVGGRTIAALDLESDDLAAFDERDEELLGFFAEAAALAIEKAMLHRQLIDREQMEAQLRIARDVQLGLLPQRAPRFEGYDIATACLPSLELGGDYYDFFSLMDQRLGIAIGDVAGKGVPAALTMATFRALLRARRDVNPSLAETALAVNRLLGESSAVRSFVTSIYVALDLGSGRLTYVSCGHPLALIARDAGTIEELENCGPVLGAFEDATYVERETTLAPGDKLILYTDGLVESLDEEGNMFGLERVFAVLQKSKERTADEIAETLIARVKAFSATTRLSDDLTLVVVGRDE